MLCFINNVLDLCLVHRIMFINNALMFDFKMILIIFKSNSSEFDEKT